MAAPCLLFPFQISGFRLKSILSLPPEGLPSVIGSCRFLISESVFAFILRYFWRVLSRNCLSCLPVSVISVCCFWVVPFIMPQQRASLSLKAIKVFSLPVTVTTGSTQSLCAAGAWPSPSRFSVGVGSLGWLTHIVNLFLGCRMLFQSYKYLLSFILGSSLVTWKRPHASWSSFYNFLDRSGTKLHPADDCSFQRPGPSVHPSQCLDDHLMFQPD